jgi:hypothetical protein
MPNLSGYPAVDVVIGLAFMFFLLSTAVSAINEMVANVLAWRAKTLEDGLRSLLGDPKVKRGWTEWLGRIKKKGVANPAQAAAIRGDSDVRDDLTTHVLEQWPVRALVRDPHSTLRRRARPSYLPPAALSLAVAEQLAGGPADANPTSAEDELEENEDDTFDDEVEYAEDEDETLWAKTDERVFASVCARVAQLPPGTARAVLQRAVADANGTLEGFRSNIEKGFDAAMERASGWYKRKVQLMLIVISIGVAVGLNVDTVHVGTRLWQDDAVRSAVAAKANAVASKPNAPSSQGAADDIADVRQLQLPVGWAKGNRPSLDDIISSVPGWLITIAALGLGAPFWFDTLSRLARLRGSGVPEKPRSLSDTAGTVQSGGGAADATVVATAAATAAAVAAAQPGTQPGDV